VDDAHWITVMVWLPSGHKEYLPLHKLWEDVTKFHTYLLLLLTRMKLFATKFLVEKYYNLSKNKYYLVHIITFPWHDKSQNIELIIANCCRSPRWKVASELVVRKVPANNLKFTTNIADTSL
jgi:hypothetical protein